MGRLRHFGISEDSAPAITQLRAVIAAFESYTHPTRLSVRSSSEDLVTVQCNGFRFIADRYDFAIGYLVIAAGGFENHVTNAIRNFLRPGMIAADIGANVGFQTMNMASILRPKGKVMAFEPSSENCRMIILNAMANDFQQVEVYPFALSDTQGTALLNPAIGSNGILRSHDPKDPSCIVVPRMSLDQIVGSQQIDFIKIDVEGAELRVMLGAQLVLQRCRPVIVSEFSPAMIAANAGDKPADYLAMMHALGYAVHLIDQQKGIQPEADHHKLLSEWGSMSRIEDVVFMPSRTSKRSPTKAKIARFLEAWRS